MYVVCFNGPPGSGKDSAADSLVIHANKNLIRAKKFKFANILKTGVHASLGIGSGPDTFEGEAKDIPNPVFFNLSPRQAYIAHSEQYMKKVYGENVFGELLCQQLKREEKHGIQLAAIADCGFRIEIEVLTKYFHPKQILIIRMQRKGHDFKNDSRSYIASDKVQSDDLWNDGSIIDLNDHCGELFYHIQRSANVGAIQL